MTTFKQLAEELSPISDQVERINDLMNAATDPVHDVIKNSAVETAVARQREIGEMFAPQKFDPAIYRLKSAGLPPPPEPVFPEIDVTVDPAVLEIEPPRWWQQGWVWGAIGSALVLINIIVTLV